MADKHRFIRVLEYEGTWQFVEEAFKRREVKEFRYMPNGVIREAVVGAGHFSDARSAPIGVTSAECGPPTAVDERDALPPAHTPELEAAAVATMLRMVERRLRKAPRVDMLMADDVAAAARRLERFSLFLGLKNPQPLGRIGGEHD